MTCYFQVRDMFVGYVDDDVTVTVPTKPTGHLQGPKQEIDETA